jgi:uncharacterized protein YjbI with pentapeptide repeats
VSTFELKGRETWKQIWKFENQPWRTEPSISKERQEYLAERRNSKPNLKQGIYPFKDIKLNRADIEWLLSTHEDGHGPINWNDERQREREGLDLRGAILRNEYLSELPLANTLFGVTLIEMGQIMTGKEVDAKAGAQLQGAKFAGAQLQGADFSTAKLQGAVLFNAKLQGANFHDAQLQRADLSLANLQGADLLGTKLQGTNLDEAQLQGANLSLAQLQGASLIGAKLQNANFCYALLQNTNLREAQLQGANLKDIKLANAQHIGPKFADIQWSDTNLAVVNWSQVILLGDELEATQHRERDGQNKTVGLHIDEYITAARAYRQLSIALRNQALNEDASRFVYRAQLMQRKVFWYQHKYGQYLFSLFLDLLSGYGY